MYHMKKATVRDLRYDFPRIERLLRQGEEVEITKRQQVIARLVPEQTARSRQLPDFLGRLKKVYGERVLKTTGAEIVSRARDRY
jgi:antitoxin (DNA-binding transcriptional repressor) of toxin-antitoxin stability system